MTAPAPAPQPPPDPAGVVAVAGNVIERTFGALERVLKSLHIQVVGNAALAILLLWLVRAHIGKIEEGHAKDAMIETKARAMAALDSSDKINAARAKFWQSEASKQAPAVKRDTEIVASTIDRAAHYYFTPTGMQIVQPDSAPPAPAIDTALPGHRFGAAVPYAVQPNTTFYTRTSDFDSLAAQSLRTQRDQEREISDDHYAISDLNVVIYDRTAERDTARADNTALRKAEGAKIRKAAVGGGVVGAIAVIIARAVLH